MHTYYRFMVWVPLALPLLVALLAHGFGIPDGPLHEPVEVLLYSLLYGGLPYLCLAIWATFRIDHRPEPEIRRLALFAPLLMLAAYAIQCAAFGVFTSEWRVAGALLLIGTGFVLGLGYAYVAITLAGAKLVRRRPPAFGTDPT